MNDLQILMNACKRSRCINPCGSSQIDEYLEEKGVQYDISDGVVYEHIQASSLPDDARSWLHYSGEEGYENLSADINYIEIPLITFRSVKLYFYSGDEFEIVDEYTADIVNVAAKTDFVVTCLNGLGDISLDNVIITPIE